MSEVVCRQCGERGYEDPDDPSPGLCPICLERRLAAAFPDHAIPYATDPAERARIWKICREIGLSEEFLATIPGLVDP